LNRCPTIARMISLPLDGSISRELTAAVNWLALLMRSQPENWLSAKICAKLKSARPVSKIGIWFWFWYGMFR
jgi:hypothetical protein